jgi:hypothetical protein
MYSLHYILPFVVYYLFLHWGGKYKEIKKKKKKSFFDFPRSKLILYGLLIGNLIDLDHIWYRIIGKVGWFDSACDHFGQQCSFNFYPLHNELSLIVLSAFFIAGFRKNKKMELISWIALGAMIHLMLDYIHLLTGFGI